MLPQARLGPGNVCPVRGAVGAVGPDRDAVAQPDAGGGAEVQQALGVRPGQVVPAVRNGRGMRAVKTELSGQQAAMSWAAINVEAAIPQQGSRVFISVVGRLV